MILMTMKQIFIFIIMISNDRENNLANYFDDYEDNEVYYLDYDINLM